MNTIKIGNQEWTTENLKLYDKGLGKTKHPIVCSCNFLDVVYMDYAEWEQQVKEELLSKFNFILPKTPFIETDMYRFFDRSKDAIYTARALNKWYNKNK